jgi:peptidoglycan/LPS O-acetylase OafA/YrhL
MDHLKAGSELHSVKYRPDIDGIRTIAVLSVVFCHAFPQYVPGGFIGVDIFFVISGYLISKIIINDLDKNRFSILNFYNRRIRRIFPALIALLLAVLAAGWFCMFRPEFALSGRHVVASTLFSENLLLWSEASYFDVSSELKPTLHLWSLAIEEQFYILWPLILYVTHRWRVPFIAVCAVFAGLSFVINLHDIHTAPTAAYYSPLGRSWELMVGSSLAYTELTWPRILGRQQNAQSVLGLAMIVLALVMVRPESAFPGFWALLPTLGTALLISAGGQAIVNRRFLALAPMVWCGLISYPLYLWHWFFLSYAHILFTTVSVVQGVACILASIVLATLTFLYIERPLRSRSKGRAQPVALFAGMVGVLCLSLVIAQGALMPRLKNFAAPTETEWTFLSHIGKRSGGGIEEVYSLGANPQKNILFIGDSHLAHYAVRIDHVLTGHPDYPGALMAIGGGCVPIEGALTDDLTRTECWPLRDEGYRLAGEPQFRRIVIGGAWAMYMLKPGYYYQADGKRLPMNQPEGCDAALARLALSVKAWKQAGKEVVFILDNPFAPGFSSTGWRTRLDLHATNYPANGHVKVSPEQMALRASLKDWAMKQGVVVIDPYAALCDRDVCRSTTDKGLPIYKDNGHFNPAWAVNGADFLDKALMPVVAPGQLAARAP